MARPNEAKDAQLKLNRACYATFTGTATPAQASMVLDYLERNYGKEVVRADKDGRVDSDATLVAAGSQRVIFDLKRRIDDGSLAR